MSKARFAGVLAVASIAIGGGQAQAASVQWAEDARYGAQVFLWTGGGEAVDLTVRAEGGVPNRPKEIVIENAAGPLDTPGTFAAPGSCDSDQSDCRSKCRAETPQRARCSVYDGYTRHPDPLNPFEGSPYHFAGVWLALDMADDRVTVPADNAVRFGLHADGSAGSDTWNVSRATAWLEEWGGDTITSGTGANVTAILSGSNTFDSVNGRADNAYCRDGSPQTIRRDIHDQTDCSGDIQPPHGPLPALPAPPDVDELLADQSARLASARRCVESNVVAPASCLNP